MKIRVGVIFGGDTVEREVSIISAIKTINSIDTNKYDIIPIYIDKDKIWYTGKMLTDIQIYKDMDLLRRYASKVSLCKKGESYFLVNTHGFFRRDIAEIDIVLPIVNGSGTEDGTLQGYLDTVGVPYVGSKVVGAAIGQDKVIMKQIFESADIPTIPYIWFFDSEYSNGKEEIFKKVNKLGLPVIVKPASLGSSIGISVVKNIDQLGAAIDDAFNYGNKIIIEKYIQNMVEVSCSVLGDYKEQQVSELEEIIKSGDILSYQDKYLGKGKSKYTKESESMTNDNKIIPSRISDKMAGEIKDVSKRVFRILNLSGVSRIDFIVDKKHNKFYVSESNTIPERLAFYLWEPTGKSFASLIDEIIDMAIEDFKKKNDKKSSLDIDVLSN